MAFTTRHETTRAHTRALGTSDRTLDPTGMALFARGLRAIVEASLIAALGFSFAVLVIGTPIALLVRGLDEGLSWLTRSGGVTGPFVEALVAVASSLGGVLLFALSVRFVLGRFWQRRARRHRMNSSDSTGTSASEKALGHHFAEAIS